ncbi:carbohydrate ABC transporter membrane protein, 1, CUT1 family [alpha proteobacterium HIMB5]|nr:carbohydrate ABC transporter membrane protein, 1, CUT1 family [alpha proteobacterium HIMB5]
MAIKINGHIKQKLYNPTLQMNFKHKYFFLFPGLFVLIGILIFPIIFVVRLSLSGWNSYNPGLDFIGLENYIRLFTDDPRFWESFFRLSFLSVTTVILQYVIGFALAHMVWKDIKFKRFFRVLFLIPMMTTPVIMTVIWRTFFHESLGPVNDILSNFGVSPKWLTDPVIAKFTVIIVEVWQWTPFMFLLLLAGLLSLPKEPFLAAAIDGASPVRKFIYVTFPLMAPISIGAIIIRLIEASKIMDTVYVLTSGGPGTSTETSSFYIFIKGLREFQMGYAASMSFTYLIIMIISLTIIAKVLTKLLLKE